MPCVTAPGMAFKNGTENNFLSFISESINIKISDKVFFEHPTADFRQKFLIKLYYSYN